MDLGKNNYLKNRIVTTIVSKLISHESGVRLALPYLLLFSMEICCLYGLMGRFLMCLTQTRLWYLLPQNDHEWSSESVICETCLFWVRTEWDHQPGSLTVSWVLMAALLEPSPCVLHVDCSCSETSPQNCFRNAFIPLTSRDCVLRNVRWALMMLAESRASC